MSQPLFGATDPVTRLPPDETMQALTAVFNQLIAGQIPPVSALQLLQIGDGTAASPIRPTTSNPVQFNTITQPPLTGTVNGGTTGMVPGLDRWVGASGGGGGGGTTVVQNLIVESPLGSGTYPNRPSSTASYTWRGAIAPNGGGTINGGTPLMVNGLDFWEQIVAG